MRSRRWLAQEASWSPGNNVVDHLLNSNNFQDKIKAQNSEYWILKDDNPKLSYWSPLNPDTVNDPTFQDLRKKDGASLMKMYGDHHILSHLWHDWLPKVYHCSNRWCPWHCHYCPFIILICPPALHPNSSDGQHIHTKLLYLWTQQKRTKWIPIPILCQFGMHELLFWLTYRLAILDWEFDQKSSSLNHHPLNWIPEVSLLEILL